MCWWFQIPTGRSINIITSIIPPPAAGTNHGSVGDWRIYLVTAEKASSWPDLTAIGIPFPRGASYQCTVGGLGPFATMDEAVGPTGLGDPFPREARRSFAQSIYLTTFR